MNRKSQKNATVKGRMNFFKKDKLRIERVETF